MIDGMSPGWCAPPSGRESAAARLRHLVEVDKSPRAREVELELCRRSIYYWLRWYGWTYDPKAPAVGDPAVVPFDLYQRQAELVDFIAARVSAREDGLVEKSRDVGFTWVAGAYAWHQWRWRPGFKTTFGSRVAGLVDGIGDPDTIFEKIRMLYRRLPRWMLPAGFDAREHDHYMLLVNPETGNVIRGEGGDEMGRGGRSTLYVLDECAFYLHAARVDASTSSNADTRIWGSTVNPWDPSSHFTQKRHGGSLRADQIFRLHYSADPRKTSAWAAAKRATMESWLWASEYEIDYSARVEDVCIPAAWVEAAKHVADHVPLVPAVDGICGGDVGGGKAESVAVARFGPVVTPPAAWGDPDTIDTAMKMLDHCKKKLPPRGDGHEPRVRVLRYDSVGIGFGVGAALKRNPEPGLVVVGVNVGEPATDTRWPDGRTAEETFANLKAEAWWTARERFRRTHEALLAATGQQGGKVHPASDLISLPGDAGGPLCQKLAAQISQPRWQRNEKGKIIIEPKVSLKKRGVASPDYADALMLTFAGTSKAEKFAAMARLQI